MASVAQPASGAKAAERARRDRERAAAQAMLVGPVGRTLLGVLMLVLGALMIYMLIALWPVIQHAVAPVKGEKAPSVHWFGWRWTTPNPDAALLMLVVLSSSVGSYVHAAVSFTDYVGNRRLYASWIWWYLLRVFVGISLAVLFYFSIRGGFLQAGSNSQDINPYGIAAVSGLVGLFSKQATDKLREIFDTAFRVEKGGDEARIDSITNPVPVLASVEPAALKPREVDFKLQGFGFCELSQVTVTRADGTTVPLTSRFVSAEQIAVQLSMTDLANETLRVTVVNPEPGGGASEPLELAIEDELQKEPPAPEA